MHGNKKKKISREEGIKIIKKYDGKYPREYLGKKLEEILKDINLDQHKFDEICDQFTNKKLFLLDNNNRPRKDNDGNLIPNFDIK